MCGIFGTVTKDQKVIPLLINALKSLEYRGYDSSGIAYLKEDNLFVTRSVGNVSKLESRIKKTKLSRSYIGIAHNRWATHGKVNTANTHPHLSQDKKIAVIHNGIIENADQLKKKLVNRGYTFRSETDTEVIPYLIESHYKKNIFTAIQKTVSQLVGSYSFAVLTEDDPGKIYVVRNESSLVMTHTKKGSYFASDIIALSPYSNKITVLDNDEIAVLEAGRINIFTLSGKKIVRRPMTCNLKSIMASKEKYKHFMLKEIFEQPVCLENMINSFVDSKRQSVKIKGLKSFQTYFKKAKRLIILGCGTSWHAALIGEYMIEEATRIPVEVEYASEFRYRNPIITKDDLVIGISQSGETSDTLAALREAKRKGAKIIAVCNTPGSTLTRESDLTLHTKAGLEIGVASTKAFSTQIASLLFFAISLGKFRRRLSMANEKIILKEFKQIPKKIAAILEEANKIKAIAERYHKHRNMLYLGRGEGYPIALEGALKLKEISYIHAEGYPAAEMKHGPIALIDEGMPSVVIALKGRRYDKILGNIQEIKSRGGKVIALATRGDRLIKRYSDHVIYIPDSRSELTAFLAVIPLQLYAYYIAKKRGCNIDQPKNLAKSVTVE